jgi:hypothetical protein
MDFEPVIVPGIILSDQLLEDRCSGKPSLIGVFDNLKFSAFPAVMNLFWATCWVSNLHGNVEQIEGDCRIDHLASGEVIAEKSVRINVHKRLDRVSWIPIAALFKDTTFSEPGTHVVVMSINGEEIGRRDFNVRYC